MNFNDETVIATFLFRLGETKQITYSFDDNKSQLFLCEKTLSGSVHLENARFRFKFNSFKTLFINLLLCT